jgi:hypothetical protein
MSEQARQTARPRNLAEYALIVMLIGIIVVAVVVAVNLLAITL